MTFSIYLLLAVVLAVNLSVGVEVPVVCWHPRFQMSSPGHPILWLLELAAPLLRAQEITARIQQAFR
jgi:hypothetical protein